MDMKKKFLDFHFIIKIIQGCFIGLGAVLPGISGGVLCVIFGIYQPVMELLAKPFHNFKTHVPKLFPVILGIVLGFFGIANILSVLLDKYPAPSICLFIGFIVGMLPSLFREAGEQGRDNKSYVCMYISMILVFALLIVLKIFSIEISPNFFWFLFCGFCLALSIIAPGMSFSTLLMPLGLYEPFVSGIGHLDFSILLPGGVGALGTIILLSKAVNTLFTKHYSCAFHGILGIVIAATIMIIPFTSFTVSLASFVINVFCISFGMICSLILDNFNQKFS